MNKPNNIWYVHPYAGGPGIGRYSRPYFLARYWQDRGVRSTVFAPSYHHLLDEPQSAGGRAVGDVPYEFIECPSYAGNGVGRLRNMFAFTWQLFRQAKTYERRHGRPDVIIASSPHPYAFLATHALARKFGAVSVFEVRDLWPLSLVELAGVSASHPFVRFTGWLERYAYRNADHVVSLLPLTLDHMSERGLPPERWSYIPNGVDVEETSQADSTHPAVALAEQWRTEGRLIVVYAGALGRPNHVDSLVRAVSRLKSAGQSNVRAVIAGRGEQEHELKELAISLELNDEVFFFGQIPKNAVHGLLKIADVGYISLRPEPLFRFGVSPNKLFDYMLAGLPIVFAVDSGNDPVSESGCGIKVSPDDLDGIADALCKILAMSESARADMGKRGRQYALDLHTYGNLASAYLETLSPLCNHTTASTFELDRSTPSR